MRLVCLVLLALLAVACGTAVECEVQCSESGSTVVRSFPSCSALRDEIARRQSGDTISSCEADALIACEDRQCGASPL